MNPESRLYFGLQKCRSIGLALALCSVVGSAIGVLLAATMGELYFLMMRSVTYNPVSIVGSIVSVFVPFFVSLYFIYHSKPWLIYCILTLHFSGFASVGSVIRDAFGSAGWLICFLLQFPIICIMPLLIYAALHILEGKKQHRLIVYSILIVCIVGMVNYLWISPLLADLITTCETMERYALYAGFDRCL